MKLKRVIVKKNERGILLRNGDFERVLPSGTHWLWDGIDALHVETFALESTAFTHPLANYLMAREPAVVAAEFVRVELGESQVGLRSENGMPVELLAPGTRRLYWKGLVDVRIEVIDIADSAQVSTEVTARLLQMQMRTRLPAGLAGVLQVQVPQHGAALLWIDGKVDRLLGPGLHAYWRYNRNVTIDEVDLRLQTLELTGQEILTRDKVALRLNLSATWRYADALKAFLQLQKPAEHLYRELQLGLRAVVGTRTLDELLEDKAAIDQGVSAQARAKLAALGLDLVGVGVKDIVLPGKMKAILAQVVEAEKAAHCSNVLGRTPAGSGRGPVV